jgi:hypothetical protein
MRHLKPTVGNRAKAVLSLRKTTMDQLVMEDHPTHADTLPSRHLITKIDAFLAYLQSLYQPVPYWDALNAPPNEAAPRRYLNRVFDHAPSSLLRKI